MDLGGNYNIYLSLPNHQLRVLPPKYTGDDHDEVLGPKRLKLFIASE